MSVSYSRCYFVSPGIRWARFSNLPTFFFLRSSYYHPKLIRQLKTFESVLTVLSAAVYRWCRTAVSCNSPGGM